jgi:type II secretion system protein I
MNREKGFTLIEVMVALVVLSIGLGALIASSSQNIRVYQRLQQRYIQSWTSLNLLNQIQLQQIKLSNTLPSTGSNFVKGIKCFWQVKKYPTPTPHLFKIEISTKMQAIGPYEHVYQAYYYE